jgi:hypothetical protein
MTAPASYSIFCQVSAKIRIRAIRASQHGSWRVSIEATGAFIDLIHNYINIFMKIRHLQHLVEFRQNSSGYKRFRSGRRGFGLSGEAVQSPKSEFIVVIPEMWRISLRDVNAMRSSLKIRQPRSHTCKYTNSIRSFVVFSVGQTGIGPWQTSCCPWIRKGSETLRFILYWQCNLNLLFADHQRLEENGPNMGSHCQGADCNYHCCFALGPLVNPRHYSVSCYSTFYVRHDVMDRSSNYCLLTGDDQELGQHGSPECEHEFPWSHSDLMTVMCNRCPSSEL